MGMGDRREVSLLAAGGSSRRPIVEGTFSVACVRVAATTRPVSSSSSSPRQLPGRQILLPATVEAVMGLAGAAAAALSLLLLLLVFCGWAAVDIVRDASSMLAMVRMVSELLYSSMRLVRDEPVSLLGGFELTANDCVINKR